MKFICNVLTICIFLISPLYAAENVITIGVETFTPPFVIQGANHQIYGYDIDMMNSLCKIMNRQCKFQLMRFDKLLNAVASKKVDAAVSSITITPERVQIVNFTMPYQLSYSRFLSNDPKDLQQPFSLSVLNNRIIGLEEGTIFSDQIKQIGVKDASFKTFNNIEQLLEALGKKNVTLSLVDNATAVYWAANSSRDFHLLGPAYLYGYGYGIAVNKTNNALLQALNKALLQYQNSAEYKVNFDKYLAGF